jgi:hypothetical protein
MDQVMKFPLWYRVVSVVGAGIAEEILFRGFSAMRVAMLTGRLWLGAVIAVVGFYALHVPVWGWGFVLGGHISGAAAMAFFIWRKDLLAMMVFRISTDAVGLVVAPLFSEWWKRPVLRRRPSVASVQTICNTTGERTLNSPIAPTAVLIRHAHPSDSISAAFRGRPGPRLLAGTV